jgi:alkanesulfonate monooxygenase SsuD/methylene tetrahydromethanopterin reductase-like flavin-dependent oxidoreductase (luciferase family)
MQMKRQLFGALALITLAMPAWAQDDEGLGEVIVTASRREMEDFDERVPVVGLRRIADFAVMPVTIVGDTRESGQRLQEVSDMLKEAIRLAQRHGVELSTGETVLRPLTLVNAEDIETGTQSYRSDTTTVEFLVKVPLTAGMTAAQAEERIETYLKAVQPVGRAEFLSGDDLSYSVVSPDQYRGAIAALIAADAREMARHLGQGVEIEVEGLNRPVEWVHKEGTSVLLYIPYRLVISATP